jgi:hypothetical protein
VTYVKDARQEGVIRNKKRRWSWTRWTRQYKGLRSPCERYEIDKSNQTPKLCFVLRLSILPLSPCTRDNWYLDKFDRDSKTRSITNGCTVLTRYCYLGCHASQNKSFF